MGRSRTVIRRQDARRERGAAVVEFVIILPFFLFLIFFLVGIAMTFSYRQALSQAATEAARAGAVQPLGTSVANRTASATTAINSTMQNQAGVSCNDGSLVCTLGQSTVNGEEVFTATLSHNLKQHPLGPLAVIQGMPLLGDILPHDLSYTASARVSR
jgi:Flp pilus assembly protein TadG